MGTYGPEISQAQQQGASAIAQSVDTNKRGLERLMGQYNIQAPNLYQMLAARMNGAGEQATKDMNVGLDQVALRNDLLNQRLALMWKQFEMQRKAAADERRQNYYSTLLGSVGQLGGSAMNIASNWKSAGAQKPKKQPPMVPSIDADPYRNPYLGLFDLGVS